MQSQIPEAWLSLNSPTALPNLSVPLSWEVGILGPRTAADPLGTLEGSALVAFLITGSS